MAIDIQATFTAGGRPLIDLLEFCVCSHQMDPVFCFLVRDFRNLPTARKATALYEGFCSPTTPARISCHRLLPPFDRRLQDAVAPLRPASPKTNDEATPDPDAADAEVSAETETPSEDDSSSPPAELPPPLPLPPKYLFDSLQRALEGISPSWIKVAQTYDPTRSPQDNLPQGRMTQSQRQFVEMVWQPQLRPFLVEAGFFRIANIA